MGVDQRPRFYEGQYLGADDLSTIVDYNRTEGARHALGAHTWGIAIGLQLKEKPAPGGDKRVEVTLQPGFAWDGLARPIAVGRPTRLSESLFASIPYNPAQDDVAAGGTGRLVRVWLVYDEAASHGPEAGFETCATDDQHARIGETFRFEIGEQPESRQRSPVRIGTNSVDARQALTTFDSLAPELFDTSVPHQRFPFDEKPPRWLIPIGLVRWVARDQALGYFAERDLDPSQKASGQIRAFRRYIGAVAERLEAADGAIVLHRRGSDPLAQSQFAHLLQATFDPAALLTDLVWVEGNLRVIGDAKVSGGDVLFRNPDGLDEGVPFYIARRGDNPAVPANAARDLRIVIGPSGQPNNRLIIGTEISAPPAPPGVEPGLVVVSTGDVGIGRRDPATRLNVVGHRIRLQDTAAPTAKRIDLRTAGNGVGIESATDTLTVRASGPTAATNQVLINPENTDGRVGLRVAAPQHDIDAKGQSIKLGLEQDGGGQLVLRHDGPDQVFVEARNGAGGGPAQELRIVGPGGASLPLVAVVAAISRFLGNVGIGPNAPTGRLTITGNSPAQGVMTVFSASSDVEYDGGADGVFVFRHLGSGVTAFMQTRVGIGTAAPLDTLHVAGPTLRVDGPSSEAAVVGGESQGAIVVGTRNNGIENVDMRKLGIPWGLGTTNQNAWLNVYCRKVYEQSDRRAKANIKAIAGSLDRVSRLRGVSFDFKGDQPASGGGQLGLVAQEVRKVVPEAVSSDDRSGAISYSTFVPLLIEAVKELKAEVDALRAEVGKLATPPAAARTTKPRAPARRSPRSSKAPA